MFESTQAILTEFFRSVPLWWWMVSFATGVVISLVWLVTEVPADGGWDLPTPVFRRLVRFWLGLRPDANDTWCVRVLMGLAIMFTPVHLQLESGIMVIPVLAILYVGTLYLALYDQFASPSSVEARQKNWAELRRFREQAAKQPNGGGDTDSPLADPCPAPVDAPVPPVSGN